MSGAAGDGADLGTVGQMARLGVMNACEGVMGHAWYGPQQAVMDHLESSNGSTCAGYLSHVASMVWCMCLKTLQLDLNTIGRHLIVSQSFCPARCDEPICVSCAMVDRAELPGWSAQWSALQCRSSQRG